MNTPKTDVKIFQTTIATSFVMFIVAILSSTFSLKLTEKIIDHSLVLNKVLDDIAPRISLGMLMVLCSVSSGVLLWAYSKNKIISLRLQRLVFGLGFMLSFISALFGIWLNLLQVRAELIQLEISSRRTAVFGIGNLDYFSWGFVTVFLICGMITLVLLWKSRKAFSKT